MAWDASMTVVKEGTHFLCRVMIACLAVSGESEGDPWAFFTGANSESLGTSMRDSCLAIGRVSKMNNSSFIPCTRACPST